MVKEHNIKIVKTARYFTLGNIGKNTKSIWFVFHGYGQLAKDFIKGFTILENDSTFIIAPEALNKFYLKGFSGKIGATWMTKEDRLNEIDDYIEMIDNVFESITKNRNVLNIKVNVLGFSQGTHTAVRWLDKHQPKIDNLILWAGSFPHDCNYEGNKSYWSNIKVGIVIGSRDRFLTKEMLENENNFLKSHNISYDFYNFDGDHEIDKGLLKKFSNKL